jgi:hypothetical protein
LAGTSGRTNRMITPSCLPWERKTIYHLNKAADSTGTMQGMGLAKKMSRKLKFDLGEKKVQNCWDQIRFSQREIEIEKREQIHALGQKHHQIKKENAWW